MYKDGDPNSAGFTISSLMVGGMEEGCEVKGFCEKPTGERFERTEMEIKSFYLPQELSDTNAAWIIESMPALPCAE